MLILPTKESVNGCHGYFLLNDSTNTGYAQLKNE
jgi:hypothetical protein